MTPRRIIALVLIIAAATILVALVISAWPATATLDPVTTPTTYKPPGPNGGPNDQ